MSIFRYKLSFRQVYLHNMLIYMHFTRAILFRTCYQSDQFYSERLWCQTFHCFLIGSDFWRLLHCLSFDLLLLLTTLVAAIPSEHHTRTFQRYQMHNRETCRQYNTELINVFRKEKQSVILQTSCRDTYFTNPVIRQDREKTDGIVNTSN